MSSEFTIKKLDTNNSELVEKYEKALFESFYDPNLVIEIQDRVVDVKNRRMKPVIPYKFLEIYYGEVDGDIINGVVMHFDISSQWEIEMYNFTKFEKTPTTCEAFCLFNNKIFHNGELVGLRLDKFSKEIFLEKKMEKVYATCFNKKLKAYKTLGWIEKEVVKVGSDDLYLLELSV